MNQVQKMPLSEVRNMMKINERNPDLLLEMERGTMRYETVLRLNSSSIVQGALSTTTSENAEVIFLQHCPCTIIVHGSGLGM